MSSVEVIPPAKPSFLARVRTFLVWLWVHLVETWRRLSPYVSVALWFAGRVIVAVARWVIDQFNKVPANATMPGALVPLEIGRFTFSTYIVGHLSYFIFMFLHAGLVAAHYLAPNPVIGTIVTTVLYAFVAMAKHLSNGPDPFETHARMIGDEDLPRIADHAS